MRDDGSLGSETNILATIRLIQLGRRTRRGLAKSMYSTLVDRSSPGNLRPARRHALRNNWAQCRQNLIASNFARGERVHGTRYAPPLTKLACATICGHQPTKRSAWNQNAKRDHC